VVAGDVSGARLVSIPFDLWFGWTYTGNSRPVLILLLVPLLPAAGLLFLLGVEQLERLGVDDAALREYARSKSALGDTIDRAREIG
jgi:hypothetical protein